MRFPRLPEFERFLRRAHPGTEGRARLGSRQVYILPTARGWLFGALLVALLFTAINYSNNLIFALTFLLAGIGHAALLLTWRNLAGLEVRLHPADHVCAGETARFPAVLFSDKGRRDTLRLSFARQREIIGNVVGNRAICLDVPCETQRRGRLRPGRLRIATEFPLGMFRAWSLVETPVQTLVYPAPLPGYPLPAGAPVEGHGAHGGEEGNEDFAGLRGYRAGDTLHRINWKSAARTEELHVKEFRDEAALSLWLDWDAVPSRELEPRLAILAAWVMEAAARGERWGMRLPGVTLTPDTGQLHRERCLAALACYGDDSS